MFEGEVCIYVDIGYRLHSWVIGRNGRLIRQICQTTGAMVHFPDSNKENTTTKSNTVSIKGSTKAVVQAKDLLRDAYPIAILVRAPSTVTKEIMVMIIRILKNYYTSTMKVVYKESSHSVMVLANKNDIDELVYVIKCMQIMLADFGPPIKEVECAMDVEPKNQKHLLKYMEEQKIKEVDEIAMKFPSTNLQTIDTTENNSTVTFIGGLPEVLRVHEHMIESMPLRIQFDFNCQFIRPEWLKHLEDKFEVEILVQHVDGRSKQTITIMGPERSSLSIMMARMEILNSKPKDIFAFLRKSWRVFGVADQLLRNAENLVLKQVSEDSKN